MQFTAQDSAKTLVYQHDWIVTADFIQAAERLVWHRKHDGLVETGIQLVEGTPYFLAIYNAEELVPGMQVRVSLLALTPAMVPRARVKRLANALRKAGVHDAGVIYKYVISTSRNDRPMLGEYEEGSLQCVVESMVGHPSTLPTQEQGTDLYSWGLPPDVVQVLHSLSFDSDGHSQSYYVDAAVWNIALSGTTPGKIEPWHQVRVCTRMDDGTHTLIIDAEQGENICPVLPLEAGEVLREVLRQIAAIEGITVTPA